MAPYPDTLSVYRELADRYDQLGQFSMRDRFLMLAAGAALDAGQAAEAERLRGRLLQQNRHHMLRPYGSFEEAVGAPDVQTYLGDLKANYPLELATQLLATLKEGKEPKPLAQRRPFGPSQPPSPSRPAIPPTAPVVDPYQPTDPPEQRESVIPYKMTEDVAMTAPIPDLTGIPRPARQMNPRGGIPIATSPAEAERQPRRETAPEPRPRAASIPRPAADAPALQPTREETGGAWLCFVLTGVAATAGVAVAAFTLARPFLPPEWLP
jgi:hypothetical protein